MTVKEKLANRDYMIVMHLGHAAWWRERIGSGILDQRQVENAKDMIRIHKAKIAEELRKTTAT